MSFTLKDIKGAVVTKQDVIKSYNKRIKSKMIDPDGMVISGAVNMGIDAQSSIPLRFNREKLANLLCSFVVKGGLEFSPPEYQAAYYKRADAIIAADKELIEVDNGS